jgi:glutamate carboxypeptidase
MGNDGLLAFLQESKEDFLGHLKAFVECESPSHGDKAASDRCGGFLKDIFEEVGFQIETLPQKGCGDHLYGELGAGAKSSLIIGHYDTVYPVGTLKTMPFKVEGDKAFGPGVLDMKGGIVMALYAIKALLRCGLLQGRQIGIFFNSDEESGSFNSSSLIVEKARQYRNVLVMEPGINELDAVKIRRFGRGTYTVTAHGKAAHSGSNAHLAISPLTELARQLLYIEMWGVNADNATFAPTIIDGGIQGVCMIPETARFTMDVRYQDNDAIEELHRKIMGLKPLSPGIRLEVQGAIDKPVMVADPTLFEHLARIGESYGVKLKGVTIGGGSDGNFTSAAGIPTLDGLGATGEFLHNPAEYIHLGHIPLRTAMLAALLAEI